MGANEEDDADDDDDESHWTLEILEERKTKKPANRLNLQKARLEQYFLLIRNASFLDWPLKRHFDCLSFCI